ncbi:MAG: hypothetical protein JOZ57_15025, partial [Abitibacteriaceae bacterium]|nr:hypothetical protein [Abditibacteriaceae bacterium]
MRRIVCTLLLYMLTFTFHSLTHAAAFTAGNLIIYRVGNGAGTLSNTGSPVFLDEYKQDGTYTNNSIALPTTFGSGSTPNPLIANGLAVAEGLLTRSADNKYLLFMGYASTIPAATSLSSTSMPSATPTPGATPIARVVGRVDASGNIDTTTALNDAYDKNSPTGAASSDGINLYTAGTGPTPAATPTTTQLSTGVRSTTLGSASS